MQCVLGKLSEDFTSKSMNPVTAEIFEAVDYVHSQLLKIGIYNKGYTLSAVQLLLSFPPEKQAFILNNLRNWKRILVANEREAFGKDGVNEAFLIEKALGYFNFRLKDHNWKSTAQNEILEIYNMEGIQLYRSMNFFSTCGYSLLDLCVNEWYVLWERPRRIVDQMAETVADVLSGKKNNDPQVYIAEHIVRETYDDGTTQPFLPRSVQVCFKNIYPTYMPDNRIAGFVATSTAKVIFIGEEALKLHFI